MIMENSKNTEERKNMEVELVFSDSGLEADDKWIKKGATGDILRRFAASIDDITSWFNQYQIDSIELWISGGIETEGIIKLAVSAKGEGGLKLTLRPKNQA
jgi:hypothetical protein